MTTTYRKLADGSTWDLQQHPDRETARRSALDRQADANRAYAGTPYPYYVRDEHGVEHRADTLPLSDRETGR